MRRRYIKIVVIWLIALALPVQAVAAATMMLCGPLHQRIALGAQSSTHDQHQAHHHGSPMADQAHHHDSLDNAQNFSIEKYSCSACAACCTGAAIGTATYLGPTVDPSKSVLVASYVVGFSGFVPETPEHPPRYILV